jgi:hypothetical protein
MGYFSFAGKFDVLSVVISLYFLEHYPACLLLASCAFSEEDTPCERLLMRLGVRESFRRITKAVW